MCIYIHKQYSFCWFLFSFHFYFCQCLLHFTIVHLLQVEFKRIVSPLKYQTRCLAAFPDQQGFLVCISPHSFKIFNPVPYLGNFISHLYFISEKQYSIVSQQWVPILYLEGLIFCNQFFSWFYLSIFHQNISPTVIMKRQKNVFLYIYPAKKGKYALLSVLFL